MLTKILANFDEKQQKKDEIDKILVENGTRDSYQLKTKCGERADFQRRDDCWGKLRR